MQTNAWTWKRECSIDFWSEISIDSFRRDLSITFLWIWKVLFWRSIWDLAVKILICFRPLPGGNFSRSGSSFREPFFKCFFVIIWRPTWFFPFSPLVLEEKLVNRDPTVETPKSLTGRPFGSMPEKLGLSFVQKLSISPLRSMDQRRISWRYRQNPRKIWIFQINFLKISPKPQKKFEFSKLIF